MCIIIGDVHQCIGHCLIPLDPCENQEYALLHKHNFFIQYENLGLLQTSLKVRLDYTIRERDTENLFVL